MVKFALVEKQCAVFLRKKNICALARILLRGRKKCTKLQQYKGPGIAKKKHRGNNYTNRKTGFIAE